MRKSFVIGVTALVVGFVAIASSARTAVASGMDPAICRQYAQTAVSDYWQNVNEGCGFGGVAWSDNYEGHYAWCMNEVLTSTWSEERKREHDLQACPRCEGYAAEAARQNDENLAYGCGYSGEAWSSDYWAHFRWCIGETPQSPDTERAKRINALHACGH